MSALHYYMFQCFFNIYTLFSGARGSFLRSRLRGAQGARLYTTAQVLGARRAPWSVLWAFKVAKSGK